MESLYQHVPLLEGSWNCVQNEGHLQKTGITAPMGADAVETHRVVTAGGEVIPGLLALTFL